MVTRSDGEADSQFWRPVLAAHILLALSFGVAYSFGIFFHHIQMSFKLSAIETSSIFSATAFLYFAVGPLSGQLADRYSVRMVVATGVLFLACGLVLTALASSYWAVIAFFSIFVGLGIGFIYVPTIRALQNYAGKSRAKATGIALSGTGVGTLAIPIISERLLEIRAWPTVLLILAGGVLALGLPASISIPKNISREASFKSATRKMLADIQFWLMFGIVFFASIGTLLSMVHIAPYAAYHGLSDGEGAFLLGLLGFGNILGRLILPFFGNRLSSTQLLKLATLGLSGSLVMWSMGEDLLSLAASAILLGLAIGGTIALYPTVAADYFGTTHLGAILGALYFGVGIAAVIGPSLASLFVDRFGDYRLSILLSAACAFLSAGLINVLEKKHLETCKARDG